MKRLRQVIEVIWCWVDSVAVTVNSLLEKMRPQRHVQLVEEGHDTFTLRLADRVENSNLPDHRVQISNGIVVDTLPPKWVSIVRGSQIELVLQSSRFLFRPLDLPRRAAEYLNGIVRSRLDRLTPWTANEAVYGWTTPTDAANDRIHLMVAATARPVVAPYLRAIESLDAASIVVTTAPKDSNADAPRIKFVEHHMRSTNNLQRIRFALVTIFILSGLSAAASIGVSAVTADSLSAERQELLKKISARKAAMRNLFEGSALRALEKQKAITPSSVYALEALSTVLPDDTYVTELRINGDKLQIVGKTNDAASLIRFIEQSPHFARATFFAPTTHSPGTTKEEFHIESQINPVFTFGL